MKLEPRVRHQLVGNTVMYSLVAAASLVTFDIVPGVVAYSLVLAIALFGFRYAVALADDLDQK